MDNDGSRISPEFGPEARAGASTQRKAMPAVMHQTALTQYVWFHSLYVDLGVHTT